MAKSCFKNRRQFKTRLPKVRRYFTFITESGFVSLRRGGSSSAPRDARMRWRARLPFRCVRRNSRVARSSRYGSHRRGDWRSRVPARALDRFGCGGRDLNLDLWVMRAPLRGASISLEVEKLPGAGIVHDRTAATSSLTSNGFGSIARMSVGSMPSTWLGPAAETTTTQCESGRSCEIARSTFIPVDHRHHQVEHDCGVSIPCDLFECSFAGESFIDLVPFTPQDGDNRVANRRVVDDDENPFCQSLRGQRAQILLCRAPLQGRFFASSADPPSS